MTSNNSIPSLLLLILIGIAVYLLLDNKCVNNLKTKFSKLCSNTEKFTDDSNLEHFEDSVDVDTSVPETNENAVTNEDTDSNDAIKFSYDAPVNSVQPIKSVQPVATGSVVPAIPVVDVPSKPVSSSVYNFEPSDENMFEINGSSLSDAFLPPIPAGTTTDSLDFKKQNMDTYNAKDFLPKEINDEWFETDFSLAKYQLNDDKLINSDRYIIGINTVGESLKNASWDIRGTVYCPKVQNISPWNNSTYEPDFNLKPLC